MDHQKLKKFLDELTGLTKKYGIEIGGCGCAGSPFLFDLKPEDALAGQHYSVDRNKDNLRLTGEESVDGVRPCLG